MDILSQAVLLAAKRKAMGGEPPQPMPEPNGYTVKQTDQMGGQIDHSPENRAFANINRRYPEMSDKTRGMDQGELRSREPSNEELARGGMRDVLPLSSADRLAPVVGALMDAAPVPAQVATGIAHGIVNQPFVAGKALSDAYSDPSLANVTNAGVQSAMVLPTAKGLAVAGGVLAGGLGIGAARDAGFGFSSPAMADLSAEDKARRAELERQLAIKPGVDGYLRPTARATAQQSIADLNRKDAEDETATRTARLKAAEKDADQKRADESAETKRKADAYTSAENRAYTARDDALKLKKPFSETSIGKIVDALGGTAPFVAASGMGGVSRLATGPSGNPAIRFGLPMLGGVAGAYASNTAKLYHDAGGETINPEYAAQKALAENLPEGHPERAAAEKRMADGANYPRLNPVREDANKQLDNWPVIMGRTAAEGVLGGLGGAEVVGALSRAPKVAGSLPGRVMEGWHDGQAAANKAKSTNQASGEALLAETGERQQLGLQARLASEDAALTQSSATRGGEVLPPTGASGGRPNRELSKTPDQDQLRLPAPAESPLPITLSEPGADKISAPVSIKNAPVVENNQAGAKKSSRQIAEVLAGANEGLTIPPGIKPNPNWAPYSSSAHDGVTSMTLDDGLTLANKGSGRVVAKDLHEMLRSKSGRTPDFDVKSTQAALDRLRKTMIANGDDPSKPLTEATLRKYKNLDPRIFGIAGAGAGAAGLSASQSEDPHIAVARALMGY